MDQVYLLLLTGGAFILAAFSAWRSYVPPQTRDVFDLRRRVEEVEEDNRAIHARFNKRSANENMAKARDGKAQAAAERQGVVAEAEAVLASQGARPAAPAPQTTDPEELRRALRAQFLGRSH